MEHYFLKLSYSTTGWKDIVQTAPTFDERLKPVRDLIASLGGSFASFHFYERAPYRNEQLQHVVLEKFAIFGRDDLFAVLAFQERNSAQAFRIALSTQPGIKSVELVSIMPFEDVVADSVGKAKKAITGSKYAGPG
ncbi:hypothetical protein [Bradyrhizobium japonicum]|jgi:hypothetical protein|uniref:hypothetical protein n=1 Tax=Bradyrhizobium japonicum TaxID=375 RepID=UPI001BAC6BF7|nr:hypothetical protein [Bradyrhizobium japonicum]MBR0913944.1 hypothetical protein [Bradyrhizobium japonicum]